jgi:hypothetical protein
LGVTPDDWLAAARVDAERRELPELVPLLAAMRAAIVRLRAAEWNDDMRATPEAAPVATPPTPS